MEARPLCLCGCGEAVGVNTKTVIAKGRRKGEYGRYKRGHWSKTTGIPAGIAADRNEYMRLYRLANHERAVASDRAKYKALKALIINHYSGGTNSCACCGEVGMAFLTIDHITPQRQRGNSGTRLYASLRAQGFPPGFQVLCFNCNCAKRDNGCCPHQVTH